MNDKDFEDMRQLIDNIRIRIERLERVVSKMAGSFTPAEWEGRKYE